MNYLRYIRPACFDICIRLDGGTWVDLKLLAKHMDVFFEERGITVLGRKRQNCQLEFAREAGTALITMQVASRHTSSEAKCTKP